MAITRPQTGSRTTMANLPSPEPVIPVVSTVEAWPPGETGRGASRTVVAPLSLAEERDLAWRWRTVGDNAALAHLVASHLGLVVRIAREFRHSGPALEDLIQEGNVGLTIAARRFDPDRGTRLATYATYWVRACMLEHVVRSHGPVRIGTTRSQRKIFFGLGRARRLLERDGETADLAHLASLLGVGEADVAAMTPRMGSYDVSLDASRDEDYRPLAIAESGPSPEDTLARVEEEDFRKSKLYQGCERLDLRERTIIQARHLRAGTPTTLAALGRKLGISRERVRQLEARAKAKLRAFVERDGRAWN